MALNIEELMSVAIENDFELLPTCATIKDREVITLKRDLLFSVNGEHSFDRAFVYLLIDEQNSVASLCYYPSITYCLPTKTNDEYIEMLDLAANLAAETTGYFLSINHDIRLEYGRRPLVSEINDCDELADITWFIMSIISYQTIIELMVNDHFKK